MKISASSSFLLATLAVSSSSCLAAPAGDPNQAMMTASTSTRQISSMPTAAAAPAMQPGERVVTEGDNILIERAALLSYLAPRADVVPMSTMVMGIPIIGPILSSAINNLESSKGGSSTSLSVDPQTMIALQASIDEVTRALQNATNPISSAVGGAAGSIVGAASAPSASDAAGDGSNSDPGPSGSSSAPSGPTQTEQDVDEKSPSDSTAAPSSSTATASPQLPVNPPNSPISTVAGAAGNPAGGVTSKLP